MPLQSHTPNPHALYQDMERAESSEALHEWEQIQPPWPQTPSTTQTANWVITDNHLHHPSSIFPPSHHEDLPVSPPLASSSCSSYPSVSGESDDGLSPVSVTGEIGRRLKLHLGLLSSGISRIVYAIRGYGVFGGGFLSLTGVAAAVMAVWLVYVKVQRWRRRVLQENNDRLVLLATVKDEKISQLLLQIAQMNEILSTRRRVPVLRAG